jgi:hypothetical protein
MIVNSTGEHSMSKWIAVDVALISSDGKKVIGKANVSFTHRSGEINYPLSMNIEGKIFTRTEDGIAKPIIRYRMVK